jgi:hypothetical protein
MNPIYFQKNSFAIMNNPLNLYLNYQPLPLYMIRIKKNLIVYLFFGVTDFETLCIIRLVKLKKV